MRHFHQQNPTDFKTQAQTDNSLYIEDAESCSIASSKVMLVPSKAKHLFGRVRFASNTESLPVLHACGVDPGLLGDSASYTVSADGFNPNAKTVIS